uniref:O-antigen ligase family protein n=1 Tax=uncultured Halomonas sp. TaxID=173971 RepID=UPI002617534E|nr:O-antigen ligase family protein [uncultured Halomonas sp.]
MSGLLILGFIALLVVLPWAHWIIPALGLIGLVPGAIAIKLVVARRRAAGAISVPLERDDWLLLLVFLAYSVGWLFDVARSEQWPADSSGWLIPLPFWPLLAAVLMLWLARYPPGVHVFWVAVCCGGLGAGLIALYESLMLGRARASNDLNAILFGNLSLLLGLLSLLALVWCLRRNHAWSYGLACLAMLAGLSGILGSLLSGTRGGWIAMPLLLLIWFWSTRGLLPTGWKHGVIALLVVVVFTAVFVPGSNITPRIAAIGPQLHQFQSGEAQGSVGLRLEMWRSGVMLWRDRPFLGWGEGAVTERVHALIAEGQLSPQIYRFRQLHSDVIDTAARRGLAGVTMLFLLYCVPLWLFWRRFRSVRGAEVQLMAGAGLMIGVAFIAFGLSQSMLRDSLGLSGFLGLSIACWVSLRGSERYAAQEQAIRTPDNL